MTIALPPTAVYALTGLIIFDAGQTGDFKMSLTVSGSGQVLWGGLGPVSSHVSAVGEASVTTRRAATTTAVTWGGAGTGFPLAVPISGLVTTVDLATLTMQWSQGTSDATATILKSGSWIRLEPIS
jgi:hypothetical protein